jgi:hypothetical protein
MGKHDETGNLPRITFLNDKGEAAFPDKGKRIYDSRKLAWEYAKTHDMVVVRDGLSWRVKNKPR